MPCSKSLKPRQSPSSHPSTSFPSSCETSVTAFGTRSFAQIVQGDYVTDFNLSSQPVSTEERPNFRLDNDRSQARGQGHSQGQQNNCNRRVNTQQKWTLALGGSISHCGFACEIPYTTSRIPERIHRHGSSLVNARVRDSIISEEMSKWDSSMLVDRWSRGREALGWEDGRGGWQISWQRRGR